jgi:hypothetical protein
MERLHHGIIANTLQIDQLLAPSKMCIQFPKKKYYLAKIDDKTNILLC